MKLMGDGSTKHDQWSVTVLTLSRQPVLMILTYRRPEWTPDSNAIQMTHFPTVFDVF
jgi:hypothetical protein